MPILWDGTVLDGELTTGRFATTMSALFGSIRHRATLRFVAFDVPVLAGVDLRGMPWQERRDRLELLAQAFELPLELPPGNLIGRAVQSLQVLRKSTSENSPAKMS